MTSIPPWPQEFLIRVVGDVDQALVADLGSVRAALEKRLRHGRQDIIRGEELARALVGEAWDELEPAVSAALGAVEAEYAAQPKRVEEARAELLAQGRHSWIARALSARLAFDLALDALGDIGALTEL